MYNFTVYLQTGAAKNYVIFKNEFIRNQKGTSTPDKCLGNIISINRLYVLGWKASLPW